MAGPARDGNRSLPWQRLFQNKRFFIFLSFLLMTAFLVKFFWPLKVSDELISAILDSKDKWVKARDIALNFLEIVAISLATVLLLSLPASILARQMSRKQGLDIRLFNVPSGHGEYLGKAIANALSTELIKIARIHESDLTSDFENSLITTTEKESSPLAEKNVKGENQISTKNSKKAELDLAQQSVPARKKLEPKRQKQMLNLAQQSVPARKKLEPKRQKQMLIVTRESSMSANFSKAVTLGFGGTTITPVELLILLQRLWAYQDPEFIIYGGVQSFGSSVHLVARMEKGNSCIDAWDVSDKLSTQETDDKVRIQLIEEVIPKLVLELAFRIYFNTLQNNRKAPIIANTWKGFQDLIQALEAYNQYIFTQDQNQLKLAKTSACAVFENERGVSLQRRDRILFRLLYSLGNAYYENPYLSQDDRLSNTAELLSKATEIAEGYSIRLDMLPDEKVSALELSNVYSRLGNVLFLQGDPASSERSFRRAIEINSDNIWNHYYLSVVLAQSQQWDAARDLVEDAKSLNIIGKSVDLELVSAEEKSLFWGRWYADLQFYHDAINAYLHEISLQPEDINLKYNLHYELASLYHKQFNKSGNLINSEDFDNALSEYQHAINIDPKNASAYNDLGILYLNLGSSYIYQEGLLDHANALLGKATEMFHQSVKLAPTFADPHYRLGLTYAIQGYQNESILEFIRTIQLQPGLIDAYLMLGSIRVSQGQVDLAINTYQIAIQKDPQAPEPHNALGNLYLDMKLDDEAIEEFKSAINLDPQNPNYYLGLGDTYRQQKNYDQAIVTYQNAIWLDPQNSLPHYSLGRVYFDMKQPDKAIAEFKKVIELDPENVDVHDWLGYLYYGQGLIFDAMTEAQHLVTLSPKNSRAQAFLAACYRKLGLETEYAKQLKIAQSMKDQPFENEYSQACFEALCGNIDEALRLLKVALEENQRLPDDARYDYDFDSIRDDPRFEELIESFEEL